MKRLRWLILGGLVYLAFLIGIFLLSQGSPERGGPIGNPEATKVESFPVTNAEESDAPNRKVPEAFMARVKPSDYVTGPEDEAVAARILPFGPRDFFQVIDAPRYVSADEAEGFMSEDEVVLGLHFGGQAKAYSIHHLNIHEMVREEIAGKPLLITW